MTSRPLRRRPRPPRRTSKLRLRNTLIGWSFILPNFLGFALLTLVPVVTLFYMSFTNWNVFGKADWIGLANFQRLIGDGSFRISVLNTLYYSVMHIPLTIVVSLGLALLLNNRLRGIAFFRTAAFFPYITSIVAIAVVWNLLFSPEYGPINQILGFFGVQNPPGWLTSAEWAMPAVVIVSTWRDMGYYMILFLAGLQTVPRELHEAARVDGANVIQRFFNVTLPCLRPTMFFVTVMLTINSFKIFDLILVMTNGGPGQSTLVLSQFIYKKGFEESQFGYASAAAVALFLMCIVVTIIQFFWNKRRSY
ncbi:sugar ABC transporter permease [Microbacterium sp. 4R-513]|uniref:carbohydrate ABC transporter permease n=1 Tax=Microbacterium sp. 4R-513 TaxID=2567934 RepID=UPI0013E1B870|nr:sugar ABC transporter permease [Microbacterium sp. 4R-513]QIG38687.1 sugar ABC transporter permease [Microbacterium sp. 4R-513]